MWRRTIRWRLLTGLPGASFPSASGPPVAIPASSHTSMSWARVRGPERAISSTATWPARSTTDWASPFRVVCASHAE